MIREFHLKEILQTPKAAWMLGVCLRTFFILTMGSVLLSQAALAQSGPDDSASDGLMVYQPFSAEEIQEALKRPLKLEECIRIALRENIALRIEEGNLNIAEASLSGSHGKFFPVLSLNGTAQRSNESRPVDTTSVEGLNKLTFNKNAVTAVYTQPLTSGATLSFSADLGSDVFSPDRFGAIPTKTEFRQYSIEFRQPLLRGSWFTIAKSPITLARQGLEIQEKLFLDKKLQTVFLTKAQFYNAILARELIKVNQAALERDSTLILLSESKLRASMATRRDVLSAEINYAADYANLISVQTDYESALDELKNVMGIPLEIPIELDAFKLKYSTDPLDMGRLMDLAIKKNPVLQSLEVAIEQQKLQLKISRNNILPQLDLTVRYTGAFDSNINLDRTIQTRDMAAFFTLNYSFLSREAAADAQSQQIAQYQRQQQYVDYRRQLILAVRNIVRIAYSNIEEIKSLKKTIIAAEEKVKFSKTMFNLGRASNLDLTDAQEALLKAQTKLAQKIVDYHVQLALLETYVGQPILN